MCLEFECEFEIEIEMKKICLFVCLLRLVFVISIFCFWQVNKVCLSLPITTNEVQVLMRRSIIKELKNKVNCAIDQLVLI